MSFNDLRKNNQGMTLIEVMIVIVIISVLTYYAFTIRRDESRIEIVNRTIVDIKHWQEAALNYYVNNNQWPPNLQALWKADENGLIYLTKQAQCSPWIGSNSVVDTCPQKMIYEGQAFGSYYTVSIKLPGKNAAKRIAAKLPNTEIDNTILKSSVSIPGYYMGGITSAGILDSRDRLYLPKCPDGYEGHFIMAPQFMTTGYEKFHTLQRRIKPGTDVELGYDDEIKNLNSAEPYIYAYNNIIVKEDSDTTENHAYYLTFCVPQGGWKPLAGYDAGANQCSSHWNDYNSAFGSPAC